MHSTLYIALSIWPSPTLSIALLLPVSSPPNHHSHSSTSQKHLLATSLTPPQQSGVNQMPVEWVDEKQQGWMTHWEAIQSLEADSVVYIVTYIHRTSISSKSLDQPSQWRLVGDGEAGAPIAVFSQRSVTQNIISTTHYCYSSPAKRPLLPHLFPLFTPFKVSHAKLPTPRHMA